PPGVYALSLHDALPIYAVVIGVPVPTGEKADDREDDRSIARAVFSGTPTSSVSPHADAIRVEGEVFPPVVMPPEASAGARPGTADRKSTRLNSSHLVIS